MYAATVEGRALTFDVRGVWRRNMIMCDRQTGTVWQHATGEALVGPLAGQRLEVLGGTLSTWAGWRQQYPQTDVGIEPTPPVEHPLLTHERANRMLRIVERVKAPGMRPHDPRVDAHARVAGLQLRGASRAYPIDALRGAGLVNDHVGGEPVVLLYDAAADRVRAFRRPGDGDLRREGAHLVGPNGGRWDLSGEPQEVVAGAAPLLAVNVSRQWWLGWSEFHPGTSVYGVD